MKAFSGRLSYLILLIGFILSALVAWGIDTLRHEATQIRIEGEMKELSHLVAGEFQVHSSALYSLQSLFNGSEQVTRDEFSGVADQIISRHPQLRYLQWAPLITEDERSAFEASQQNDDPRYLVQEVSEKGIWVPARPRGKHYPVLYHSEGPGGSGSMRAGFDLASDPVLRKAINQSFREQRPVVAEPGKARWMPESNVRTVMAVLPVLSQGAGSGTDTLKGFLTARLTLDYLMRDAMQGARTSGLHIALIDLVTLQSRGGDAAVVFSQQPVTPPVMDMQQRYQLDIGGRDWQLVVAPSEGFLSERKSEMAYIVAMTGLLITGFLAAYLRMMSRRNREIETVAEQRNQALQQANKKLAHLSQTDGLTQIANRRFFDNSLEQEWKRSRREKQPLSLVLFDLDFFKQYNDQFGHLEGDECLRNIAELVRSVINRPGDLFARFGGEEFVLLLPNTPYSGAMVIAEQCRQLVESIAIPHHKSQISEVVTISVGVCSLVPDEGMTSYELLDLTDQALYCAKDRGRNRVVNASDEGFTPRERKH